MASYWELEDGSGHWLLEDGSGAWLLENSGAVSITITSPASLNANTSTAVAVSGTDTAWTAGTTFSVSGVSGCSVNSVVVDVGAQTATFNVVTGSSSGTLIISESSDSATATITVNPPVPSFHVVSPGFALPSTTTTVTVQGISTSWTSGTTFSCTGVAGASISAPSINVGAQSATFTLTTGAALGVITISDSTDSATATFTISNGGGNANAGSLTMKGLFMGM